MKVTPLRLHTDRIVFYYLAVEVEDAEARPWPGGDAPFRRLVAASLDYAFDLDRPDDGWGFVTGVATYAPVDADGHDGKRLYVEPIGSSLREAETNALVEMTRPKDPPSLAVAL